MDGLGINYAPKVHDTIGRLVFRGLAVGNRHFGGTSVSGGQQRGFVELFEKRLPDGETTTLRAGALSNYVKLLEGKCERTAEFY